MGLQEVQEEIKEELAKLEGADKEEVVQEETKIIEEAPVEEVIAEEETVEESDEEEKEPELDSTGYARLRRELAAEKKLRAEAEARNNPSEQSVEIAQDDHVNSEIADIINDRKYQKASEEFASLEEGFKSNVPDYDAISNGYKTALYQSIRVQNPEKSHSELLRETRDTMLRKAGTYVNKGLDPIQELYEEAKALGIKPIASEQEEKEEIVKPDLKNIAKNKAKNAGTIGAPGSGTGGQLTQEGAASLTTAEWSKLSAAEKTRLMSGG